MRLVMKTSRERSGLSLYSLAVPALAVVFIAAWAMAKTVWLSDVTPDEVTAATAGGGAVVMLDGVATWKDDAAATRLTAVVERSPQQQTRWFYDLTAAEVEMRVQEHLVERIDDISAYWSPNGLRFAIIFVPNRGANAVDWWWFHGQEASAVQANLVERGADLVDIEGYRGDRGTLFAGVMVKPPAKPRVDPSPSPRN
jgi:hypothetical protein